MLVWLCHVMPCLSDGDEGWFMQGLLEASCFIWRFTDGTGTGVWQRSIAFNYAREPDSKIVLVR